MWVLNARNLLCSFVISLVLCHSVSAASCKTGCQSPNKSSKYKFQPGNVYSYGLDSFVQVQLTAEEVDAQQTTLKVDGKVEIYAADDCQYTLKVLSLTAYAPDGKKSQFGNDIGKPVQFSFSNDELFPELCAESTDSDFSLNVKRGIISLLQSAESKSYETDVFGVCQTSFSNFATGDATVVNKVRDLAGCSYRETISNTLVSSVVNSKAGIKSTPYLNANYNSQQTFKNGMLVSVKLNEEYKYVPFAKLTSGAVAKVTTKFTYAGSKSGSAPALTSGTSRSVIFENPQSDSQGNLDTIKQQLKTVVESYDNNNVGKQTASHFTELVHLMQHSKKDDLLSLYQQTKAGTVHTNKVLSRKAYLDALFRVGTGASVEALASLYKTKEFSDPHEQKLMFVSLNLVTSMNKAALKTSKVFLDGNPPREAYLSVGSLVHKYCQKFGCASADVKDISDKFAAKLGKCQPTSRAEEDIIVAVLKGVKNTHNLVAPLLDKVVQCTSDKSSSRVRVAAFQAYPAASCQKKVVNSALDFFKNADEDSEIRIQAYLSLVECPSAAVANEIKALLDTEKVYQVGSFVSTHLASLRSSVDPTRDAARQHFGNIRTTNKFPFDFRRYSFNREFSYAVESLGMGASVDTSVIYSQRSFLPKSVTFNVSTEAFGNGFNVFEVQGRQDNMDRLIEHYFGPKGFFRGLNLQSAYDKLVEQYNKLSDQAKSRFRRGLKEDVKSFANSVNLHNDALEDFNLDVSVKFFGSELFFLSSGDNMPHTPEEFLDKLLECFEKFLEGAKKYDRVFEQHTLFVDADLVYPTAAGLPLKLSYEGTGVARLETSLEVDLKAIAKDYKNTKFNLKLVPSASYEVSGTLSVDAFTVSTGLQLSGTVHTATGSAVSFALLDDGKAYDLTVDSLFKKQELVSFSSKLVFVTRERGNQLISLPLKMNQQVKEFKECFDNLYHIIGVTLCASAGQKQIPGKALVPLDGEYRAELYLEVDPKYHFSGKYDDSDKQHQSLLLTFDTPGTDKKRTTSLKLESYFKGDAYVKATVLSPLRNVDVTIGLNNNEKEAALYALAHNGPEEYSAKIGFEKAGSSDRQEYIPIFTVKTPTGDAQVASIVKTTGKIVVEKGDGGATVYKLENVQWTSAYVPETTVNGFVSQNGPSFDTDLVIAVGSSKNNVKGHLDFSPKHINVDLDRKSVNDANKNFKVNVEIAYTENSFKNVLVFVAGKDFNNPTNRYELNQNAEFEVEDKKLTSLKLTNKLQLPKQMVRLDLATNKNQFKLDGEYGYDKYKIAAAVDAKYNEKSAGDYDVTVGASLNKHNFKFTSKRTLDAAKSKFQNRLTASTGTKIEVNGVASNKFTEQEGELNLEGLFVAVEKADPYKMTLAVQLSPATVLSNAKVLVGKDEFANYDLKVDRTDKSNGKFNFVVTNFFEGNGDFKSNNGQGDGTVLINFVKQERKLKLDTKFKVASPVYDIVTDFYYDFDKDNTKKIHFDTKNKVTKSSFDSKNKLEVFTEKYEFNVQGQQTGQLSDGTVNGKFSLVLPTGRQLSGDIKREVNGKDEKKTTGSIVANLVDKLPSGKQQSLSLTGDLKDGNMKSRFFDSTHELKYTNFDGKDVDVELDTKHLPVGHFKKAVFHVKVKGALVPAVSDFGFYLDEYCEQHAVYRVSGKYGADFDGTVSGNYHVGKVGKAHTHEVTANVNVPKAPIKTLAVESKGSYLEPEGESGLFALEYAGSFKYNEKAVSVSTVAKGNVNHGSGSLKLNLPDIAPFSAEAQYNYDGKENGPVSTKGSLKVNYGKGKTLGFTGEAKALGVDDVSVHATLKSDFDHIKNVELTFKHVKSGENAFNSKLNLVADEKAYSVENAVFLSETSPSIDFNLGYPGKSVKVYGAYKVLSDRAFKAEAKVLNFGDFNLDTTVEANYQSYETFFAKAYLDAPKLNAKKLSLEVNSKPGSSGKGVEFKASSDGKNVVSGYADYSVKEQGKSTIIEGQGNVKLYDKQQQTASFKLTREKLQDAGYAFTLGASVDKTTVSTEVRVRTNDFYLKTKVCEKNQCTNVEVQSKLERTGAKYNHEALVSVDLQQLGYDHEFGLKAKTSGNGFTLDHTTDVHLKEKKQPKYQYQLYIHPNSAGASLILPTRSIVVEGVFKYPKEEKFGQYDSTISFYLDKKNAPNNKATFGFTGETKTVGAAGVSGSGALKFSHPTMKDLVVSISGVLDGEKQTVDGKVVLDVFKNANDKIVAQAKYINSDQSFKGFNVSTELSVASKGLGFDCGFNGHSALSLATKQLSTAASLNLPFEHFRFGSHLFVSPEELDFLLKRFNDDLVRAHGTYDSKNNKAELTTTFKIVPNRPVVMQTSVNGLSSAKFSLNQDKFFNVDGTFALDKAASLKVTGLEQEMLSAKIALDASHFLSTEYQVNEANAKSFLSAFNKQLQSDLESTKVEFEKKYTQLTADVNKVMNNAIAAFPDVSKLQEDYGKQLGKLQEDLLQDPAIKELFDQLLKVYKSINDVVMQLHNVFSESMTKITAIVTDVAGKLTETFNKNILPVLKELYTKMETVTFNIYEETVKLLVAVFERSVKALKTFEEDFNKVAKNFSEMFKSFAQTFNKAITTLEKEFKELYKAVQDYLDSFDEFKVLKETLKEQFEGLDKYAYQLLRELLTLAEDLYPVPEIKTFTSSVNKYITSKLDNKPVNDVEELKTIFINFVKAVNMLFEKFTTSVTTTLDEPGFAGGLPAFVTLKFFPYITSFKFSPLNYLRNEKFLSVRDFLYQFRPYAWNPFDVVPPFAMHGEIADGSHYFTFDGQHFTFAGSCNYILASDFVDGNFSLVANVQEGKLKSITLIDKDVLEVNDKGVVSVNGKVSDLPVHKNEVHAWRRFYTVNLLSTYGASVMCTTDLKVCHFSVSGFYLGKLRGLLGNGNYEPYDDYTLPNGKVAQSSTEFANSYKSTKSCGAVADAGHASHEHSSPVCAKLFGSDSSLRYCYFFKDQSNFREACEHAVHDAQDADTAACNIAFAYASACRLEMIPVNVPAQCQKCSVSGKDISVGDQFSVKSPQKQADVVLVVDTTLGALLGELVQASINDLRKELKSSGIPDVHVVVLGYNRNQKYVSLFTSGGSLDYTGKLGQADVSGPEYHKPLVTGNQNVDQFFKTLHELGEKTAEDLALTSDARAFLQALQYPFRPTASKSIVLVHSDDSEKVPNPTRALKSLLATLDLKSKGVGLHVVTPVKGLGIANSKDQKKVKEIVGFNSKQAFTLADSKKRTNVGSTELKNNLKFETDLLVDMVQKNDGFVFALQNFSGLKQAKDKKSFVAVLASALGDHISRTEIHSDCVCTQRNGLHAEESCEAKETKFLPPSKKTGGVKG